MQDAITEYLRWVAYKQQTFISQVLEAGKYVPSSLVRVYLLFHRCLFVCPRKVKGLRQFSGISFLSLAFLRNKIIRCLKSTA